MWHSWLFSAVFLVLLVVWVAFIRRVCERRFGHHEPGLYPADRPGCGAPENANERPV